MLQDLSEYVGNYGRISSMDALKRLIDMLYSQNKTISFDIETGYQGPDKKGAALDAYSPDQFVVGFAITNDVRWARYVPVLHDFGSNLPPEEVWSLMKPLLEDKIVTCHNIGFEARNMNALERKGHGPNIDLFKTGFHDTMLQSYTLSETQYHGLKPLTLERFNYHQSPIDSLFEKITDKQKSCIRFNPLLITDPKITNYVCDDVTWTLRHDQYQRPKVESERAFIYKLELEIVQILVEMANVGVSVDWEGMSSGQAEFDSFYQQMELKTKSMFEASVGRDLTTLNFNSPVQMATLLFDSDEGLGLEATQKTKKSGNPSTSEKSIEALRNQHPAIDQLLKYRQTKKMGEFFGIWNKYKNSYDLKVHPGFKQTTVQSGRFACAEPNVQNVRKDWWFTCADRDFNEFPETKEGEKAFRSHVIETGTNGVDYWNGNARDFLVASPGYTLLSFDYSQQELRVLAGLAKEPYLQEAFAAKKDIHKATASLMFNVPLDEVTDEQRQRAKTINFGLIYQQGAKALGDSLGITTEEAQSLFDKYFSAFSKVDQWFAKVKREGKAKGYVESFFGRKSTIWELQSQYKAVQSKADRMFVNVPVQGGGADITKIAMVRSKRALQKKGWWMTKVRLLMNQHDSLVYEVSDDLDLQEVRSIIAPEVSFPVPGFPEFAIDWEYGKKWGTGTKWKDGPAITVSPVKAQKSQELIEEKLVPCDLVVEFKESPETKLATSIISLLKSTPGGTPVVFSLNGQEKVVGLCVDPTINLQSEIVTLSSGSVQTIMREIK